MRKIITTLLLALSMSAVAQDFNHYFEDATLRLDYIFAGNAKEQTIAVDELSRIPHWYGKHERLAEVRDHRTQKVIYRNSFSTLFQEWLTYDEAQGNSKKSFENVFLVPYPKDTADVTIELRNNRREVTNRMTHIVVPQNILIRHIGEHNITPYETLQQAADPSHCIHIAYIAEGYTEAEMPTFIKDCRIAMEALFAHEPFKSLRSRFNIVAVKAPSIDSGTSEPSKGIWKNTALHSHFDTFYSDRYLTTLHLKDLHDWLAGTPYEHIIVLVNTEKYGGGGIMPDYFVPLDTTKYTKYHRLLAAKNIIMNAYLKYVDANRTTLKDLYKSFDTFNKNYVVPQSLLDTIIAEGKKEKVEPKDKAELTATMPYIKVQLKALVARDLWDMNEYYRIWNEQSDIVNKAVKLAGDKE